MNQLGGFPLLTIVVALPLLGAGIGLLVPRSRPDATRWVALLTAATALFVALFLPMGWLDDETGSVQFVDGPWSWLDALGLNYYLGVDGISLHLVLLTTFLVPLFMIYDWVGRPEQPGARERTLGVLLLESALLGTFCALDLAALLSFWVAALLATTYLVSRESAAQGSAAARWLAAVTALVAVSALAVIVGFASRGMSLDLPTLTATPIPWGAQVWMFWVLVGVCGLTMAAFPLHLWYPAASRSLPVTLRALLGSILLNLGGYGLIRFCVPLFPLAATRFGPAIAVAGVVGLLYGALVALGQDTLSASVAYWRVAQGGLVIAGVFAMEDAGLHGALLHLLACSLTSAALLLLGEARGEDRPAAAARFAPQWSHLGIALAFLSGVGIPGTVGALGLATLLVQAIGGEWLTSSDAGDWIQRIAILAGVLLCQAALLRAWRREARTRQGLHTQQALVALALPVLIVLLGLYPTLISDPIGPTVYRVLEDAVERVERDLDMLGPIAGAARADPPPIAWNWTSAPRPRPVAVPAPGFWPQGVSP
ncbi:MAG: hypothetical protein JXA09_17570 [Anaerolineae bacterium]|nr:hypothetical protein [Anaerolineae bacterium]